MKIVTLLVLVMFNDVVCCLVLVASLVCIAAVEYTPLANCSTACTEDRHQCTACIDSFYSCPTGLSPGDRDPTQELDESTCYQTDCTSGGCPAPLVEDPAHTPGEICFNYDIRQCHSGVCRCVSWPRAAGRQQRAEKLCPWAMQDCQGSKSSHVAHGIACTQHVSLSACPSWE